MNGVGETGQRHAKESTWTAFLHYIQKYLSIFCLLDLASSGVIKQLSSTLLMTASPLAHSQGHHTPKPQSGKRKVLENGAHVPQTAHFGRPHNDNRQLPQEHDQCLEDICPDDCLQSTLQGDKF